MKATPVSQVLLSIDKPIQDEIITEGGLKLFLAGDYDKAWNATVTAKVVALPTKCDPKHKKILDSLSVGDEVAISYLVCADLDFQSDAHRFMPVTDGNDLMREWINGKSEKLRVYALPGKISKIWVGVFQDRYNNLIDGMQGSESQMNRWLSQFELGKTDTYAFNNFFEYEKQDLWKCDLTEIFAKKVDGHLVAVGDRIICKPVEEEVPEEVKKSLNHDGEMKIRYTDRGRVISGGKEKGLKKDQIISFNPMFLEKYKFFNKDYYLVSENRVLGIWSKN